MFEGNLNGGESIVRAVTTSTSALRARKTSLLSMSNAAAVRTTQTIQYNAKNKMVMSETRELASLERGKVSSKSDDEWRNELLYIPPLPPTNLRGCHLIKIQYDVYVSNVDEAVCSGRVNDMCACEGNLIFRLRMF